MTGVRRSRPSRKQWKKSGFALLAVIWGAGIISLLIVSFMTTGRLRLQTAHNIASATQASYVAEGAVNLATLALLAERDASVAQPDAVIYDGAPRFCVFDGTAVAIAIEEESGKVDINAAPPQLLKAMLTGFGLDLPVADLVANMIVAFRTPPGDILQLRSAPETSDKPFGSKRAPFDTVMELDQVSGIEPALFRAIIPFVTVHSRSAGVDARTSPPALFAALAGFPTEQVQALKATPYPNGLNRNDPRFPANFKQPGDRGAFLIHAEVALATGQTAAKDAIVDLRPASGRQFALKELRRGQSKYVDQLRAVIGANGVGVPDC